MTAGGSLSRRRFLQLAAAGGATAGLAACTSADATQAGQVAGRPTGLTGGAPGPGSFAAARYGGTVVTGWSAEANSYDAALGYDLHSWEAITSLLYTPLYQYAGQFGGPAPSAAAARPVVTDNGTLYTIRLRPDVYFHNGRRVRAQDYVYAWTRVLDPKLASWASSYLLSIEGAAKVNAGKAKTLAGVRALDDQTIEVRLTAPDITFPTVLCQPFTAALPAEEVSRLGDAFSRTPVGNGPFRIVSYDSRAQRSRFKANKQFFFKRTPFLDGVEYRWGIDPSLQFLQLRKGDLDVLGEGIAISEAGEAQGNASLRRAFLDEIPVNGISFVAPNYKNPVLRDKRVRQALNWATDRDQLAKFTHGTTAAWGSAFPKNETDFSRTATPYGLDLDRARSLMRQAGVESVNFEFLVDGDDATWSLLAQVLQQQWAEIGVHLRLTTMSESAFYAATYKQQGDMYGTHWYQVQTSALDIINANFITKASSNYNGYSNKQVDALSARAQAAPTVQQSNAILAGVEELLDEDAAAIFIGSLNFLAARSPRVHNYQMRGETGSYYDRMWV